MTFHTFSWPNDKRSHLEFDVQTQGYEWKLVAARKWAEEFCEWIAVPLELVNENIWGGFIVDSITNMRLSHIENQAVDDAKDQNLFNESVLSR